MQTFLPLPSFQESAAVLDWRRLGNQRVECKQLLAALGFEITTEGRLIERPKGKWKNHPASKMWQGFEVALAQYQMTVIWEWTRRGYTNNMDFIDPCGGIFMMPPWMGDEKFHESHRSNLLRKDPLHYGKFGWKCRDDLEYQWPELSAPGSREYKLIEGTSR